MQGIFSYTAAALSISWCSQLAQANTLDVPQHYNYLEASYAYQSTDWGPYEEENNTTFLASAAIFEYAHVHARYNNGDTSFPKSVRQDGWLTYGIGFHYYTSAATSFFIGYDKHELKAHQSSRRPDQDGNEWKAGVRHDINDQWRVTLEAGEHDLVVEDDTTFIVEALYQPFTNDVGFTFRVRDYDELDLSSYELGVRWSF